MRLRIAFDLLADPSPAAASEGEQDGWVTFGRVKVDIENETETFERIPLKENKDGA